MGFGVLRLRGMFGAQKPVGRSAKFSRAFVKTLDFSDVGLRVKPLYEAIPSQRLQNPLSKLEDDVALDAPRLSWRRWLGQRRGNGQQV